MAKKEDKKSENVVLEKEYTVPLRKKFSKAPKHKRVPKAIKALKKFIAKHMKVEERDLKKIKIDKFLNEEMWFRGIKKPPSKIKVKAKKFEDGRVMVELVELSEKAKWKKQKEEKLKKVAEKKKEKKKAEEEERKKTEEEKKEEGKEKKEKEEKEEAGKEKAVKEAKEKAVKEAEKKHKERVHRAEEKKGPKHQMRKALEK